MQKVLLSQRKHHHRYALLGSNHTSGPENFQSTIVIYLVLAQLQAVATSDMLTLRQLVFTKQSKGH